MAGKEKYYVVWKGLQPGIYRSWTDCERQVKGVEGSSYKSFKTAEEAEEAFKVGENVAARKTTGGAKKRTKALDGLQNPPDYRHDTVLPLPPEVSANAIAVDAACSGNPGAMEYRGVDLATGQQLFHFGPVYGTNNIGEFLAIVHALALFDKHGVTGKTVYSDSRNAILWVKKKQCKTKLPLDSRTAELHSIISRAENWLRSHRVATPIVKWETTKWGEIPADFGRKG